MEKRCAHAASAQMSAALKASPASTAEPQPHPTASPYVLWKDFHDSNVKAWSQLLAVGGVLFVGFEQWMMHSQLSGIKADLGAQLTCVRARTELGASMAAGDPALRRAGRRR